MCVSQNVRSGNNNNKYKLIHILRNFCAKTSILWFQTIHTGITAPYNFSVVLCVFVSTVMYFNKPLPQERVYRDVAPLSCYTDGILNIYHRNVICLLLGSGPTMGWSFLWGLFWGPVAGQRWCFLFGPFRGCHQNSRLWWHCSGPQKKRSLLGNPTVGEKLIMALWQQPHHRNVVYLLLGCGPIMGWSFLWGPFEDPLLDKGGVFFSVRSKAVTETHHITWTIYWTTTTSVTALLGNNGVVFSLGSVLRAHGRGKFILLIQG
jgi:hypothetical protein